MIRQAKIINMAFIAIDSFIYKLYILSKNNTDDRGMFITNYKRTNQALRNIFKINKYKFSADNDRAK